MADSLWHIALTIRTIRYKPYAISQLERGDRWFDKLTMNGSNIADLIFKPFALSFVEGLLWSLTQSNEAYESFSADLLVKGHEEILY